MNLMNLIYFKTCRHLMKVSKLFILVTIFYTVIISIIPAITLKITGIIVNSIQESSSLEYIIHLIIIYFIILSFQLLLKNLYELYSTKVEHRFNVYIKDTIHLKISKLSMKDFENSETYNKIIRATQESEGNMFQYMNGIIGLIGNSISLISYLLIIIGLNMGLISVIIVLPVINFVVINKINNDFYTIMVRRTNDERKAQYVENCIADGSAYKETKLNSTFDFFREKYRTFIDQFHKENYQVQKRYIRSNLIFGFFGFIVDGCIYIYIALLGIKKIILAGDIIIYLNAISNVKDLINGILLQMSQLTLQKKKVSHVYQLLDMEYLKVSDGGIEISKINHIALENLCYKYSNSDEYAIKNISLEINDNTNYYLVGKNGCGKSTLVKLICGFYNDYEGHIYINGINLKEIDLDSYRKQVSVLFQDFMKYEASVAENVYLSNVKQRDDKKKVIELLEFFLMKNKLINKNRGLDSHLGYWFNNGKQLSLGEWQKVALARTFFKQSSLVILDEPNASLDPISSNIILNRINKKNDGNIVITVAHKFAHYMRGDSNVIMLDEGKLICTGRSDQLYTNNSYYRKIYDSQNKI